MAVYIYLALGCAFLGILLTFVVIFLCYYFAIDVTQNMWILAVPAILAVTLNILFIELYLNCKKKKP